MLGKAVFEGILVDLRFAPFFLKKFSGKICDVNDLSSYDSELYHNLVGLKNYQGNLSDLNVTFTVASEIKGQL